MCLFKKCDCYPKLPSLEEKEFKNLQAQLAHALHVGEDRFASIRRLRSEIQELKQENKRLHALAFGAHYGLGAHYGQEKDSLKRDNGALREENIRLSILLDEANAKREALRRQSPITEYEVIGWLAARKLAPVSDESLRKLVAERDKAEHALERYKQDAKANRAYVREQLRGLADGL